jgi:hypothetical protein
LLPCFALAGPSNGSSVPLTAFLIAPGWTDYVFAFHDREEIGPKMLARIAKHTGLTPEDL